ncbi:MAG: flagellar biosynthesis regulator FlaF [Paracoccus sp. (in: a-proteobacteria)]|nr:flagellar biosynthesis regulator FlaF [Paracoccus sp. (in: a-proteobacteria)]
MNAVTLLPHHGYRNPVIRSSRDAEYDAFSRVTRGLRLAERRCVSAAAIQAVHLNNELWTILAADLAAPGNALPEDLRANLLSLAGFSLRHGHQILSGEGSTDILIDINMAVMKGLRGEGMA